MPHQTVTTSRRPAHNSDFIRFPLSLFNNDLIHHQSRPHDEGILTEVKCDKKKFRVNLDVQTFRPSEISVKTRGKFVVIEGNQEEQQDGLNFTSHHFENRYLLPENAIPDELQYNLGSDGILQVEVARDGGYDPMQQFMGAAYAS